MNCPRLQPWEKRKKDIGFSHLYKPCSWLKARVLFVLHYPQAKALKQFSITRSFLRFVHILSTKRQPSQFIFQLYQSCKYTRSGKEKNEFFFNISERSIF